MTLLTMLRLILYTVGFVLGFYMGAALVLQGFLRGIDRG